MALNWINAEEYSFNSFLLLERFQIQLMMDSHGWRNNKEKWRRCMGIALRANPAVRWYLERRCPECADATWDLIANAPLTANAEEIRAAEIYTLHSVEDFTIYTTPELMGKQCDFIRGWNKARLFELADFAGKTVLDVGAGSGRLTFAAAEQAAWVYASEPVGTLREFIRNKASNGKIGNIRVLDGFITSLPFPDDTFDIVMSGHVIGDEYDAEIAEITRVCKPGGWLIDCPGDSMRDITLDTERTSRGFEAIRYVGSFRYELYCYRKQIWKGGII